MAGGVVQPTGALTMIGSAAVPLAGRFKVSRHTLPQANTTVSPAIRPELIKRAKLRHGPWPGSLASTAS